MFRVSKPNARNWKPETRNFLTFLRSLGSVLRASLHAVGNADRVQCSANHVIADAWKIFHAAPADQHDRVLLQVVPDSGDIRRNLNAIGQPYTRHLAQSRVRLFRGLCVHARAYSALLRTALQCGACRLVTGPLP